MTFFKHAALASVLGIGVCLNNAFAAPPLHAIMPDIVVAPDGSGDFTSVQAAIDSIPKSNRERTIIYLKNGTYNEHLRIEDRSFLTLLGEDRYRTRIVWEINDGRKDPNANADGQGIASFNLHNVNDLVIDNLTIDNPANLGLKPIVVMSRGEGTRIVIQNADITGLGGDTLSLWTKGMYYHRNIRVTGTYHFVGPRGTCYMVDSVIEPLGEKDLNALFNEGMDDERQKFVLHRVRFTAAKPFRLGSWFRDGAWYFVDCQFPETLQSDGYPALEAKDGYHFQWPTDRIYFANCTGPDYPWLKDNIDQSPAKTSNAVNAAWTFFGQWDPESTTGPVVTSTRAKDGELTVIFAEPVTVRGRPAIRLTDGKAATYKSGSGTTELVFTAPAGSAVAPKSFDLAKGTIMASQASAKLRLVSEASWP